MSQILRSVVLACLVFWFAVPAKAAAFDWEACIDECAEHRDILHRDKAFACFEGCTEKLEKHVFATSGAEEAACVKKQCLPQLEAALKRCHRRYADSAYYEDKLMNACRDAAEQAAHECSRECGSTGEMLD
jgi:hypothetical protein